MSSRITTSDSYNNKNTDRQIGKWKNRHTDRQTDLRNQ